MANYFFTSESVTGGHPDKICDQISDAVLDAILAEDKNGDIYPLVKAADKLSAYIKCVEELKAGNMEFKKAAEQTRRALSEMHMPELDYFMVNCMESFSMTLDELE